MGEKTIMKIALLRRVYDSDGGGAERVAANFTREFLRLGHSVTVFSEKFKAQKNASPDWNPVVPGYIPSFSKTLSFHRAVQKELKKHAFDIVYSMCRTFPADVFRVTEQLHSEWMPIGYSKLALLNPRHRSLLKLEKQIFTGNKVRRIVTNSELVKRQIISRYGFEEHRVSVIRNGVDRTVFYPPDGKNEKLALRKKLGISTERLVLLFVAGNFRIKGLEQSIRVISGIEKRIRDNILLMVIGGGNSAPYAKLAEDLSLSGNISFAGSRKNMRDYYAASDLLFYPSLYEPFANVCLEACASALPVLTTELNGSSELVENRKNGYLVKNADRIDEMRSAVTDFAGLSEAVRADFSKAAYEASIPYEWEKHAGELEKLFKKIIMEKESNGNKDKRT
ncbi:MAG: hypothetical protein A2017_08200 [Lentisphaerae bacterium GWF2_44_16]|nr:MAG: hypothetical protein A2017_08200 [Lentisphaerae bacterium GWF2_44_16]